MSDLREYIENAIARETITIDSCKGNENPQIRELVVIANARKEAFESIHQALNGNASLLRIFAGL